MPTVEKSTSEKFAAPAPTSAPAPARAGGHAGRATRGHSAGALLRVLLRHGPNPRSTLARLSGLSPASVTGHSADLIDRGLIAELPGTAAPSGMGRPHVPLDLAPAALVGALHVALAETTAALLDLRGRVVAEHRFPHAGAPAEAVLTQAADALHALAAVHTSRQPDAGTAGRLLGVGLATGGWVDRDAGVVAEHSLLGWRDVPAAAIVAGRLAEMAEMAGQVEIVEQAGAAGWPGTAGTADHSGQPVPAIRAGTARPAPSRIRRSAAGSGSPAVHVDSHTRALIRAEQLFGRLDPRHSVLALFAGNVVDAAFALGAHVNRGPRSGAGDVAHWPVAGSHHACACGRNGCLQTALSELRLVEQGIAAGLVDDSAQEPDPVESLLQIAEAGDAAARELFVARSALAGRALAPLADFLNPDVVLVVDRGTARFGSALSALNDALAEHSFVARTRQPAVVVSSFMHRPLAVAAGTVALDVLYRDPLAVAPRRAAS